MTQLVPPPKPYIGPTSPVRARYDAVERRALQPEQDGIPIDRQLVVRALARRWWLILLAGGVAAGAAVALTRHATRMYAASAVVQVQQTSRGNYTDGLVLRDPGLTDPALAQLAMPQIEAVRGRTVASAVVDSEPLGTRVRPVGFPSTVLEEVGLVPASPATSVPLTFGAGGVRVGTAPMVPYGVPIVVGGLRFTVTRRPLPRELTPGARPRLEVVDRESAIAEFAGSVGGRPREKSTLIDIRYVGPDRDAARRLANRTALAFEAFSAQNAQQQARRRRVFIGEQLARVDSQLRTSEVALSEFRARQQAFSAADKFRGQQADLERLRLLERDAASSRALALGVLANFERGTPEARGSATRMIGSLPGVGASPLVSGELSKLVGYESARAELTSGPHALTGTHPSVLRLDSLIAGAQSAAYGTLRAHLASVEAQQRDLAAQRAARERELGTLPQANARETQLLQNDAVLREQGTVLRAEYQRARIAEAVAVGPIAVVELAARANTLATGRGRTVTMAGLVGLIFGTAGVLVPVLLDRAMRRRSDVEGALGLPVLATVPRLAGEPGALARVTAGLVPRWGRRAQGDAQSRRRVALATLHPRANPGAEAYRQLRATLFSTRYGISPRKLLVTSALPSEGKTCIAINLATSLARQGMRVLLVDGDLRNPHVHEILGLSVGPGLSEMLVAGVAPSELMRQAGVSGMFVLTAGAADDRASDLLAGPRLRAALNDLAQRFEAIIIDAPPALAVADASVLGAASDAVLFVVRAGQTTATDAADGVRRLAQSGAPIAGVVFNDPDAEAYDSARAGQYYQYYAGAHG